MAQAEIYHHINKLKTIPDGVCERAKDCDGSHHDLDSNQQSDPRGNRPHDQNHRAEPVGHFVVVVELDARGSFGRLQHQGDEEATVRV